MKTTNGSPCDDVRFRSIAGRIGLGYYARRPVIAQLCSVQLHVAVILAVSIREP